MAQLLVVWRCVCLLSWLACCLFLQPVPAAPLPTQPTVCWQLTGLVSCRSDKTAVGGVQRTQLWVAHRHVCVDFAVVVHCLWSGTVLHSSSACITLTLHGSQSNLVQNSFNLFRVPAFLSWGRWLLSRQRQAACAGYLPEGPST